MTMQTTALPPGGSTFAPNRRDGVPRDSRIQVIDERGNFTYVLYKSCDLYQTDIAAQTSMPKLNDGV